MYNRSGLTINWQTLTHLRVCMDPPDYIYVLRECTALESFTVAPAGGEVVPWTEDMPPNDTGTFITLLPRVNHLNLWDIYATIQALCDYITAPGLKDITLKLDYKPTEPVGWSESAIQFVRCSSCFLKNFELGNTPESCIRGLLELENMKTLTRLDVSLHIYLGKILSETIINMLNPSIHTSCLPELEELYLLGKYHGHFKALSEMMISRLSPLPKTDDRPSVKKIQMLCIDIHCASQDFDSTTLQQFQEELQSYAGRVQADIY